MIELNANSQPLHYEEWLNHFNDLPASTQSAIAEALLGKTLELYINPTERCNFRCTYCYEDFAIGRMNSDIVARLKKFICLKIDGKRKVYTNWFGGEPLLALTVILDVCAYTMELCKAAGAEFVGGISTNGYLLNVETARKLVSLRQKFFQVSFDGDQKAHDAVRRRADGRGTFSVIWENLKAIAGSDLDFTMLLRLHVRPGAEDSLRSLLQSLEDVVGGDKRFIVGFHALCNLGGPTGGTFEVLTQQEYQDVTKRLSERYGRTLMAAPIENNPASQVACGATVCYAAKPHAFFIRADGRVGKCTVAMDKEYNVIGKLDEDGQLSIAKDRLDKWTVGMRTLDQADLSCPLSLGDAHFDCGSSVE